MSNYALIGDVHIGRKFRSRDIPLEAKGIREQVLAAQFKMKVEEAVKEVSEEGKEGIIIMGDLFDSFSVNYDDLMTAYHILKNCIPEDISVYILAGNHDLSKDRTRTSAFDILSMLLPKINFVRDVTKIGVDLLVPYYPSDELAEKLSDYKGLCCTVYGHFEETDFSWLRTWFLRVFSGHIHCRRQEGNLTVVGSIMPLTFAEDPTNTFMKTCTLAEYEEDHNLGVSYGRCYRLKLKEGEELPSHPACLQMSKYIEPKTTKKEVDLNVDFEPFDIEKLMHEALDSLGLYNEVYNQYLENKMSEVESV